MTDVYNVYCDESCHLENDHQKAMVLGAVWCPLEKTREVAVRLREIKKKHGLSPHFEVKWTKISPAKKELYLDLVNFFFDDVDLHFRAVIVPDKSILCHDAFPGQDHDQWYYKMYYTMLKPIFKHDAHYRIYLDIKDTRGATKTATLHEVLCNSMKDFSQDVIERLQLVHSHEIEQMQLADLLIGAMAYLNRGLSGNAGKIAVIERIHQRSGIRLDKTSRLDEQKVNLLCWVASEGIG